MSVPGDLRYTDHDEWVRVDGDIATIGITDFAQGELGELVHVELPDVGSTVKAGAEVCEVESVKAVAQVYSMVSGEVVEVNEALADSPEIVNNDPYSGGWLFKVKLSNAADTNGLMDAATYEKKIAR